MKTAKEILYEKAQANNDGFLTGQIRWIVEAMHEYGRQFIHFTWIKPQYNEEWEEIERTADELKIKVAELKKSFDAGVLRQMDWMDWMELENTDSNTFTSLFYTLPMRCIPIINAIRNHEKIAAPIVLFRKGKRPYLVAGNNRLVCCAACGIIPEVYEINV